jgi:hypothetical protein
MQTTQITVERFQRIANHMGTRFRTIDAENCVAEAWADLVLRGHDPSPSLLYAQAIRKCVPANRKFITEQKNWKLYEETLLPTDGYRPLVNKEGRDLVKVRARQKAAWAKRTDVDRVERNRKDRERRAAKKLAAVR